MPEVPMSTCQHGCSKQLGDSVHDAHHYRAALACKIQKMAPQMKGV